ncbi:hypothetical protein ACOBQX_09220 [Actinokineospora sp. G85]|uniref:hypothetical protein n=1 Tax=Actinokineospora sp. G85 TaxID=3406626 RepID=UPI003C7177CB
MTSRPRVTPFASRAARGGLVTFFATALALAAHAAGGGGGPGSVVVLVAVLVGWVGTAVADRQVGMPGVVVALGTVQVVLHGLMTAFGGTSHGRHHAHDHHTEPVAPGAMAAGHVVAVLLTAFVLTRADQAVSEVANALARVAPSPPPVVPPLVWLVVPDVRTAARTPVLAVWGRAAARRGPPA